MSLKDALERFAAATKQSSVESDIRAACNATHQHATPGQRSAGNYRKGRVTIHGMEIAIENPRDSFREGVDKDGKPWKSLLHAHYGYFTGTKAVDGGAVDVFIGPDPHSEFVAVVDQYAGDAFDESKVVLGCHTKEEAGKLYLSNYQKGWKLGPVTSCTVHQLKAWLKDGDHKKPFAGQTLKAAGFTGALANAGEMMATRVLPGSDMANNAATAASTVTTALGSTPGMLVRGGEMLDNGMTVANTVHGVTKGVNVARGVASTASVGGAALQGVAHTADHLLGSVAAPMLAAQYATQGARMIGDPKYREETYKNQINAANQGYASSAIQGVSNPAATHPATHPPVQPSGTSAATPGAGVAKPPGQPLQGIGPAAKPALPKTGPGMKAAADMSGDVFQEITGGRPYPDSYLPGEFSELMEAIREGNLAHIKEEFGDTAYAAHMRLHQATGLSLPMVFAQGAVDKFRRRNAAWNKKFGEHGVPFSVDHLAGGSNYHHPAKVRAAFASAGHELPEGDETRISNEMMADALHPHITADREMRVNDAISKLSESDVSENPVVRGKEGADAWIAGHWLEGLHPGEKEAAGFVKERALANTDHNRIHARLHELHKRVEDTGSPWGRQKAASSDRMAELWHAAKSEPGLIDPDEPMSDEPADAAKPIHDDDGNMVGFYTDWKSKAGNPSIGEIYIDPEHRRKGHAERAVRAYHATHPDMVWFTHKNNTASRGLAEKIGLVPREAKNVKPENMMYGEPESKEAAAKGIPDRGEYGDLSTLTPGQMLEYVAQEHLADRAGHHVDLRFGDENGMHSWALPKGMPAPGAKHLAVHQPVHDLSYAGFQGEIPKGEYGAGTVKTKDRGKVLVTAAEPNNISFVTAHKKSPEFYTLVKPDKDGGDWLLVNHTPVDAAAHAPGLLDKPHYKELPWDEAKNRLHEFTAEPKADGASNLFRLGPKGVEVMSYRATPEGASIIHTHRMFHHGGKMDIPEDLHGTVARGELLGFRGDRAIPPEELGGLLNSSVAGSIGKQKERGINLRAMLYNLKDFKGTPAERRQALSRVAEALGDKFFVPEQAEDPEAIEDLHSRVASGGHPVTSEGLMLYPKAGGDPYKVKNKAEHDVIIRGVFAGRNGLEGIGAGGYSYSHTPDGPVAGEVGTGLSREDRIDMAEHPEDWIGRTARVRASRIMPSGALFQPSHKALHEDKPQLKVAAVMYHGEYDEPETKGASATVLLDPKSTGPEAIHEALKQLDLDALEREHTNIVKHGPKTKRDHSVRVLGIIRGLRRNNVTPSDLMITKVPVLPPLFRPFGVVGDTFTPGDSNELYKDLLSHRDMYNKTRSVLGEEGSRDAWNSLRQAVKASYGFAESPNPKTQARGISGFLEQLAGGRAKHSYVQRRLLSKTMDSVSRGVIVPDPDLDMDHVGIPEDSLWKQYGSHVQRRLVRSGMAPSDALRHITGRTNIATKALDDEMAERPVILSRSPAWHKYNCLAAWPKRVEGDAIRISPSTTTGFNADFDGDAQFAHIQLLRRVEVVSK